MQGKRIEQPRSIFGASNGDYWCDPSGSWHGIAPNGLMCGLRLHTVTEHDDGTISVSPSILVSNGDGGMRWHGYLTAGVWEEC